MKTTIRFAALVVGMVLPLMVAWADDYSDAIGVFKTAGESSHFFKDSYGYTVFPSIGKAASAPRMVLALCGG